MRIGISTGITRFKKVAATASRWILSLGNWNDDGVWDDNALWRDS